MCIEEQMTRVRILPGSDTEIRVNNGADKKYVLEMEKLDARRG